MVEIAFIAAFALLSWAAIWLYRAWRREWPKGQSHKSYWSDR